MDFPKIPPPFENRPYDGSTRTMARLKPDIHVDESNQLGLRISSLRKERGITQIDMADRLGITQALVSKYERGDLRLHGPLIAKIASVLAVSTDDLLGVRNKPKPVVSGPLGKGKKLFDEISKLPRRKQDKVYEVVSALVDQFKRKAS
jgi:transcriptional regulator with XRE-family HTH domain